MKPFCLALLLLLSPTAICDELRGVVVRITDGDTLQIRCGEEIHKIRLIGIDAPESGQAFGGDSRQTLAELTAGKPVVVIWSKRDRYGRLLGVVLVGSLNVNLEQLRMGYAWYFARYAKDCPEIERVQFATAEAEARSAGVGLWKQQQPVPPWVWRRLVKQKAR